MTSNNDGFNKKIDEIISEMANERVFDIFVENNESKSLGLKLSTGIIESVEFNDKDIPMKISDSFLKILQDFVIKGKIKLVEYANEYQTSGRQFYSFLYDIVALVNYLDELPKKFLTLTTIDGNADTLMHKRIQAEIALKYSKKGFDVDLEVKNKKGKQVDLIIDSIEVEIKTIISPSENSKDSCIKFANTVKDKFESAHEQFEDKGTLCVAPWSMVMNNILKEYYAGLYSTNLPDIIKDKSILILSGENAFEDYYLEFESDKIVSSTHFFGQNGYEYLNPMSYLDLFRRRGFLVSRKGNPKAMSKTGFYFKIN